MPAAEEIAGAMGLPMASIVEKLRAMEHGGLVETFEDPEQLGRFRAMISEKAARRLGLTLNRKGDRWMIEAGTATPPDFGKFSWITEKARRKGSLGQVARALRHRWPMSEADRETLRAAIAWLLQSGEPFPREVTLA